MATPYESAQLLIKLYELRRDAKMRTARDWFIRYFNPESPDDIVAVIRGDESWKYRMVVGFWDMACSLVAHHAIDETMFRDANPEIVPTFSKIQPHLPALREMFDAPHYLKHMETFVMSMPEAEQRLAKIREQLKGVS